MRAAKGLSTIPPPNRKPRKHGGCAPQRGLSSSQVAVLIVRDRHGATTDAVLPATNSVTVGKVLKPILNSDTLLCTDGAGFFKKAAKDGGFAHQPLNVSAGTRVKERVFHIQNVNNYHSRLKGWMFDFNGVATKYLANYIGWWRMLDHYGSLLSPDVILTSAIGL